MANDYAKQHPQDKTNTVLQNYPAPFPALEEWYSDNATASSVISLSDNTTVVEIEATGTAAAIKWIQSTDTTASVVTTTVTGSDFDHIVPVNTFRRFVVPVDTTISQNHQSVQGVNRYNGLYQRIAYKTFGAGSVALSEF